MEFLELGAGTLLDLIKEKYLGKQVVDSRSAAGNWLQFTLEEIEKGSASISVEVRKEMTNVYGMIHGGMMSLVMDEVIGWAILSLDADYHYTSVNLNVDFLFAVKESDRLLATANVVRHGKKIINAEVNVYDSAGKLAARAVSNLVVTGMKLK